MKTYDLYGVKSENLEEARVALEKALGINFVAHESSYRGGDYYRFGAAGDEEFILQNNFDPFEKEWTKEEFQEYGVLLYVDQTLRAQEIQKLLTESIPGLTLLKRESL